MYGDRVTVVECAVGMTDGLHVEVGLHQRSDLDTSLFTVVRLTDEAREEHLWTVLCCLLRSLRSVVITESRMK